MLKRGFVCAWLIASNTLPEICTVGQGPELLQHGEFCVPGYTAIGHSSLINRHCQRCLFEQEASAGVELYTRRDGEDVQDEDPSHITRLELLIDPASFTRNLKKRATLN